MPYEHGMTYMEIVTLRQCGMAPSYAMFFCSSFDHLLFLDRFLEIANSSESKGGLRDVLVPITVIC